MIWPKIKEIIVKGERPGSFGYQRKLNIATDIFSVLHDELNLSAKELKLFDEDKEVTVALLNKCHIENIYKNL